MFTWNKSTWVGLGGATVLGLLLAACGSSPEAQEESSASQPEESLRIAQVYQGTLGDESYNDAMFDAVAEAQEDFGVSYDYVEAWAYADMEGYLRDYTETQEYDLIIVGSFQIEWALKQMAARFPDQKFLSFNAIVDAPNVISYGFISEEAYFLAGLMAGQLTETNTVGFISGTENPRMDHNLAGLEAGVRWFNPDGQIVFDFVGSWTDTLKAKELALSQYGRGADIIFNIGSPLGVMDAAREREAYLIGFMDVRPMAPDQILLSIDYDMAGLTYQTVKDLEAGQFNRFAEYIGLAEGAIYMSENMHPSVTDAMRTRSEEVAARVASGEIKLPEGRAFVDEFLAEYAPGG